MAPILILSGQRRNWPDSLIHVDYRKCQRPKSIAETSYVMRIACGTTFYNKVDLEIRSDWIARGVQWWVMQSSIEETDSI